MIDYTTSSHGHVSSLSSLPSIPLLSLLHLPLYTFKTPIFFFSSSSSFFFPMDGDELSPHLIYRPSSPAGFDIPDYLPLRRVKPLPKRKHSLSSPDLARSLPLNTTMLPPILPPPPGPDATAEELIAHAEVLSAQITFQSYFLPTLTDVTDFNTTTTTATTSVDDMPLVVNPSPADLDVTSLINEVRENDHTDQTQQQGNAKKRKVPAHLSGLQMGPDDSADVLHSGSEGEEKQPGGEKVPPSSPAASAAMTSPEEEPFQGGGAEGGDGHQGKLLPATMVGLRKKQVLKHRRRQLAALLGSLSLGDSLALDQALLANYAPVVNEKRSGAGSGGEGSSNRNARHKSRLKRRRASRVVRRHRTLPPRPPSEPTRRIFPDSEFTFLSSNAGVSFGIVFVACVRVSDCLI
jgi:hypothetical protein